MKRLLPLVVCLLCLLPIQTTATQMFVDETEPFSLEYYNISFDVPGGFDYYVEAENDKDFYQGFCSKDGEEIMFSLDHYTDDLAETYELLGSSWEDHYLDYEGAEETTAAETTIDDCPAKIYVIEYKEDGKDMSAVITYVLSGQVRIDMLYTTETFEAYDLYKSIISSIKIEK